eukprot:1195145-Prorocentrum_minimum.AAC.5
MIARPPTGQGALGGCVGGWGDAHMPVSRALWGLARARTESIIGIFAAARARYPRLLLLEVFK